MKKNGSILLNLFLLLFGICGIGFTVFGDGFMNTDAFLYYTMQSNLLAMLTAAVSLVFEARRRRNKAIPKAVDFLRLLNVIAITLTFLVFSLMLAPKMIMDGSGDYLLSPGNLFVHNLVPICAILDWCFYGNTARLKRSSALCGMAPALAYVCFVYVCVAGGIPFSGNTVPYFFLDYQTYGWLKIGGGIGVVYWIVLLAGVLVGLGYAFMAIARHRDHRNSQTAEAS